MNEQQLDVTGIGNAIVDVLHQVDDSFVAAEGFSKGSMSLIDAKRALNLCQKLERPEQHSGGSAGNTIAGLAALGVRTGYIGKVGADGLGEVFARDMHDAGVEFRTVPSSSGTPTARCIVLVSPDAQRTMCTFLGACVELGPEDVDTDLISRSEITYLEGYLWDPPRAKEAFIAAAQRAHDATRRVALSLSDSFCVERHRESLLAFVRSHVDIVFANESELLSLYQSADVHSALSAAKADCRVVAVTRGADGAVVSWDGDVVEVPAEPATRVVDTTGAGDLFAAGFLYGLTRRRTATECATLGCTAAAEVIGQFGARPKEDLKTLVDARLGT